MQKQVKDIVWLKDIGKDRIQNNPVNIEKTKELSTRQIVKKAIENIKINYPVDPFYHAFRYRYDTCMSSS